MIKYTILLVRNPSLKFDDFVRYHKEVHAKLFMSIPAVRNTVRATFNNIVFSSTCRAFPWSGSTA